MYSCIFSRSSMSYSAFKVPQLSITLNQDEDFGIQEQTSTELVHCIYSSSESSIINMQQTCFSCLARRTLSIGAVRSYAAVPKRPHTPKARSSGETSVRRSPRARFGLSGPFASDHRVDRPQGSTTNGESSKARSGGSRRSRLAGFLDEDGTSGRSKAVEDLSRTPNGTMTSEASRTKHFTRTDGSRPSLTNRNTSMHGREPLYPPPRNSTTEVSKPRQSFREPLYPSPQPSQSEGPSSSRRKVSHPRYTHSNTNGLVSLQVPPPRYSNSSISPSLHPFKSYNQVSRQLPIPASCSNTYPPYPTSASIPS